MTPGTEALLARVHRAVAEDASTEAALELRSELAHPLDLGTRVLLLVALSYSELMRTRFSSALHRAEEAVEAAAAGDSAPLAAAAHALCLAFVGPTERTSLDQLAQAFQRARDLAGDLEDPFHRYLLGEAAMSHGAIDVAIESSDPHAPGSDPVLSALQTQVRVRALAFGGRLDEAAAAVDSLETQSRELGSRSLEGVAAGLDAYVSAQRGDVTQVRRAARAGLALAQAPASHYLHAGTHVLVAYGLAADGQLPLAAATMLTGAGPELGRVQFVDRAYGYELLAGAALEAHDPEGAEHWLALSLALPCTGMAAAAVARTEATVRAATGRLPEGVAAAQRAVSDAATRGGHLDAERARVLHGSALSRIGSRQRALDELERVTRSATELGALRIRAAAVREMRRLGRRVPPPGREAQALSPREQQVALLVADGMSNRQVGRVLELSERTVASHVATILRRLELSSRAGLPAALGLPAQPTPDVDLTERQAEVAELVAAGRSNAEIALALGISNKTVEKHVGDALARCGVPSRTALAAYWHGRV